MSAASILTSVAGSTFKIALPHLLNPWTRRKTLEHLYTELLNTCDSTEKANDLYARVKDDATLGRIASLRTVRDVHQVIERAIHPLSVTDPQHAEAVLLTRALLVSLLQATSPNPSTGITNTMILDLYLREELPAFNAMILDIRRRRKHPGLTAQADLEDLLRRAGQTQMGIAVMPGQPAQVFGQPNIKVRMTGRNAQLFREWARGGQGATLRLKGEDGKVDVSYGHPELDRMLLPKPAGATVEYEISEVMTSFGARVRVSAPDKTDVYCPVTIEYAPRTKVLVVKFGEQNCQVRFTLTQRAGGQTSINVGLDIQTQDRPLPGTHRTVLRAMKLLGLPDMRVTLPAGEVLVRPDGSTLTVGRDELLFDGRLWPSTTAAGEPDLQDYLGVLGEVHLLYQEITTHLEEQHGVDPAQVLLLEELDDDVISLLHRTAAAIAGREHAISVTVNFDVDSETGELLADSGSGDQDSAAQVVLQVSGLLDLGVRVVTVRSVIRELHVQAVTRRKDATAIEATGILREHMLEVHPAGSFGRLAQGSGDAAG